MASNITFTNPFLWVSKWKVGGEEFTGRLGWQYEPKQNVYGQWIRRGLAYDNTTGDKWQYVEETHVIKFWWEPQELLNDLYYNAMFGVYFQITGFAAAGATGLGILSSVRLADKNPITASNAIISGSDAAYNEDDIVGEEGHVAGDGWDCYSGEIRILITRTMCGIG